ncbi:MAG: TauD/TfdA dioxygenase family protein [Alphaproteobacteria bacterium]
MPQPVLGERLSPAGGISIAGIDLTRPLPPEARDTIIAAILEHHIAIFPGQSLSREQQFAFAANFGEVERHGTGKRHGVAHVMSNLGTSPFRGEGRHHARVHVSNRSDSRARPTTTGLGFEMGAYVSVDEALKLLNLAGLSTCNR